MKYNEHMMPADDEPKGAPKEEQFSPQEKVNELLLSRATMDPELEDLYTQAQNASYPSTSPAELVRLIGALEAKLETIDWHHMAVVQAAINNLKLWQMTHNPPAIEEGGLDFEEL